MTARRLLLAMLWSAVMAAEIGAVALMVGYDPPTSYVLDLLVALSMITAAVIALDRRPGDRLAWLLTGVALTWVPPPYTVLDVVPVTFVATLGQNLGPALLAHLVLAYPSGRLRTRGERVLVAAMYVACLWPQVVAILATPAPASLTCVSCGWYPVAPAWVSPFGIGQTVVLALGFAVALLLRWRRSSPVERQRLRPLWVVAAVLTAFEVLGVLVAGPWGDFMNFLWQVRMLVLIVVPLLFLYGLLAADRAGSAVARLVLRLRDGVVPGGLGPVLAEAVGDPGLQLFYATRTGTAWSTTDGHVVEALGSLEDRHHAVTVIERDGRPYAAMVHDPNVGEELVRGVASAAAISMENEWLHAELRAQLEEVRASRARIVSAGDRERRRVERDLHDGAQQRLLALALSLRSARRHLGSTPSDEAARALDAAEVELMAAIEELRELASGIHPTILTEVGLDPALRALAARATVPVAVDVQLESRPSSAVEATAYFAVGECLANVSKHAGATRAVVSGRLVEGVLDLEIADDGVGGAVLGAGSGLRGLVDRVSAVEGRLEITSPSGGGTSVCIRIPVESGARP